MTPVSFFHSVRLSSGIRTILRNATALAVANIGVRILSLFYMILLTRQAGVNSVGAYSLATAIGGYVFLIADFGLNNYVIQYASAAQEKVESLFNAVLKLKSLFVVFIIPLIILFSFTFGDSADQVALIALISAGFVINSLTRLNYAVLRAHEKMVFEAIFTFISSFLFVGLAYVALEELTFLYWVGIAFLLTKLLEFGISSWTREKLLFSSSIASVPLDWKMLMSGVPFGVTAVVSTAFTQIDILIIALVASVNMVGEYTIVSRLLLATSVIPIVLGSSVWPKAARLYSTNDVRFRKLVTWFVGFSVVVAVALVLIVTTTTETILTITYGDEYLYLAPLLRIGALFVVFKFLSLSMGYALTSADRQRNRALAVLVGLALTIILVVVLVPLIGVAGAVWSLVISEIVLTLALSYFARDLFLWKNVSFVLGFVLLAVAVSVHLSNFLFPTSSSSAQIVKAVTAVITYVGLLGPILAFLYIRDVRDKGMA